MTKPQNASGELAGRVLSVPARQIQSLYRPFDPPAMAVRTSLPPMHRLFSALVVVLRSYDCAASSIHLCCVRSIRPILPLCPDVPEKRVRCCMRQ